MNLLYRELREDIDFDAFVQFLKEKSYFMRSFNKELNPDYWAYCHQIINVLNSRGYASDIEKYLNECKEKAKVATVKNRLNLLIEKFKNNF